MTQTTLSQTEESIKLDIFAKDVAVALILQITGLAITYLLQIFLARWMGKTEYGIYQYVISWSLLLAIPAGLGLPKAVLRFISQYKVQKDWSRLRGVILSSWLTTLVASFLVCLGAVTVIFSYNYYHSFTYFAPLLLGIWMIPLQALLQLQLQTARAIESIPLAYAPSQIIWPILVLGGGFFIWEKNHDLTSIPMIGMAMVMLLIAILLQLWLLWEKINREIETAPLIQSHREWLRVALPLLLQGGFQILLTQTDILMIGSFIGPEDAGIYHAAVKTATWVAFILQIVNMVAAPAFVTLHTQKDFVGLQKLVSTVTVWIFWPTLVVGCVLIVFTKPVLVVFGSEFVRATLSLKILILGQVVNALCGSVGNLMVITGHQNKSATVLGCVVVINVVGNAIAIPLFGVVGAAIATTLTMIIRNIWLSVLVAKNIGVHPSIFYSIFGEKEIESA